MVVSDQKIVNLCFAGFWETMVGFYMTQSLP